jgi:hypothetical protein
MAIVKNPVRKDEKKAEAFIGAAGKGSDESAAHENKKPIMIRLDPALRARIDKARAKLGGMSVSAFLAQSAVEKLDRMESTI